MRHRHFNVEWLFWLVAIGVLSTVNPLAPPLIELCAWKLMGFSSCPGCGMGHALAHILDGGLLAAIDAHPLSPFATVAIITRLRATWPRATRVSSASA